eukprot:scaffold23542_cov242-Isochrysis_galbana.AAC.1
MRLSTAHHQAAEMIARRERVGRPTRSRFISISCHYPHRAQKPVIFVASARARGGVTMEPLQLRLEPTEVVLATGKGAARAR